MSKIKNYLYTPSGIIVPETLVEEMYEFEKPDESFEDWLTEKINAGEYIEYNAPVSPPNKFQFIKNLFISIKNKFS